MLLEIKRSNLLKNLFLIFCCALACHVQAKSDKKITASSWLVADSNGTIIKGENIDEVRSIASITKLLTVMVVLDAKQDLTELVHVAKFPPGYVPKNKISALTRKEHIELTLIKSDNNSARALCEAYPGGYDICILAINNKLQSLGLSNSQVFDSSGLNNKNVSTARELIEVVKAGLQYAEIIKASKKTKIKINVKKKWFIFANTNPLVGKKQSIIVSKTGYTRAAGGCIVMYMSTNLGDRIVIVLGSQNTHTRIPEAEFISEMEN